MYRRIALAFMAASLAACSNAGSIGDILGGVLGGAGASTLAGIVRGVDTRSGQVSIQDSQGQTVALSYDNQTQVVYNNQTYPITSLEVGDQVNAHVSQTTGGSYYTDRIDVTQSLATGPDDAIFSRVDFIDGAEFYFLSGRRNPTRFDILAEISWKGYQADLLRSLERDPPKLVIGTFGSFIGDEARDYLDKGWKQVASFGSTAVLGRKEDAK